jgi:N6-L-threonylcarbamoyladenine synthase
MTDGSLDFSFSGLKTAALKLVREHKISKSQPHFFDFLASFEMAVIRALLSNLAQAIKLFKPESLVLCGGVARNKKLRHHFTEFGREQRLAYFIPSPVFCTDNAAMVASLGLVKLKSGKKPSFSLDLNAYPRSEY